MGVKLWCGCEAPVLYVGEFAIPAKDPMEVEAYANGHERSSEHALDPERADRDKVLVKEICHVHRKWRVVEYERA